MLACLILATSASAGVYKYQDSKGNWHFSDKKPAASVSAQVEQLEFKTPSDTRSRLKLETEADESSINYLVDNPFPAPFECFFRQGNEQVSALIREYSTALLHQTAKHQKQDEFYFWCVMGDPENKPTKYDYLPPFKSYKPMKVSQGFNGQFSHTHEPNQHAIDIAMPVGTKISAVRGGVVVSTKDDYPIGGVSSPFFLDKANYVEVMHDDGSYAIYAHLLLGSVKVTTGDQVVAGDLLGASGNTGYSSGPHLHFAIRYNKNGKETSLPFKFSQPDNKIVIPVRGMWLLPVNN